jgi:ribosome-binding protein aMBF1 (putative translation factor)
VDFFLTLPTDALDTHVLGAHLRTNADRRASAARGRCARYAEQLRHEPATEPGFKEGYDALAAEFAVASVLIKARTRAGLSQAELAKKMGTSQSTIARLESGSAKPSLSALERFAKATGMTMRVVFEPAKVARKRRSGRAA